MTMRRCSLRQLILAASVALAPTIARAQIPAILDPHADVQQSIDPAYAERDPFDAASMPRALAEVRAFLAEQRVIRLWVSSGPRFGHQTAAIRVIRRLRELGYDGLVQIVIGNAELVPRLNALIPGANLREGMSSRFDSHELGRLSFTTPARARAFRPARLGLSAAQDSSTAPAMRELLNVDAMLILQPRWWNPGGWPSPHRSSERELALANGDRIWLQHLLDFGPALRRRDVGDWRGFVLREMGDAPAAGFVAALGERFHNIDVLPAYALDYPLRSAPPALMSAGSARMLVESLLAAQAQRPDLWTKPIAIVDFSRHDGAGQMDALKSSLRELNVPYFEAGEAGALGALQAPRPAGSIAFIHVGQAPPAAMEEVFLRASLPGICEGKNLTDVLLSAGRPFLHAVRSTGELWTELAANGETGPEANLIRAAFAQAIDRDRGFVPARIDPIARYLNAAHEPDGPVPRLFQRLASGDDVRAFNHDLVARGILEAMAGLRRMHEPAPLPPTRPSAPQCPAFRGGR